MTTGAVNQLVSNPVAQWARKNIQPPTNAYVTPDDTIIVSYHYLTDFDVVARYRILTPRGLVVIGEFEHANNLTPAPSKRSYAYSLPEGYLLSFIIENPTGPITRRGQLHALVSLMHGEAGQVTQTQCLLSGYIERNTPLSYPLMPPESSLSGIGHRRIIAGTNPAAGNEIVETCPLFTRWRLLGLRFNFITSGVGGTRYVSIVVDDQFRTWMQCTTQQGQAPGLGRTYSAAPSLGPMTTLGIVNHISLPADVILESGDSFRTLTTNMDAADVFTFPEYCVEELVCR